MLRNLFSSVQVIVVCWSAGITSLEGQVSSVDECEFITISYTIVVIGQVVLTTRSNQRFD